MSRLFVAAAFIGLALSSCASKPQQQTLLSSNRAEQSAETTQQANDTSEALSTKTSFFPSMGNTEDTNALASSPFLNLPDRLVQPFAPRINSGLTGRTILVSNIQDIALANKEVVLTFDDGPVPGKTEKILDALRDYNVKATFLMVGSMAQSYPKIAQKVVADGHSIGSHTFNHPNLRQMSLAQAMSEIYRGEAAVRKATNTEVGFFRFPYLADTASLRSSLSQQGRVVMDVQVDSKDYFKDTPHTVAQRTMNALRARGSGIILFHDIHNRTVAMLPLLLKQLKAEGYSVVQLVYDNPHKNYDVVASLN